MPRTTKAAKSIYSVHPGVAMVMKWVADLKEKTGRTLEEWSALIRKEGPATVAERRRWLKGKFKIGSNTAWWLAERADGQPTWDESPEAYLAIAPKYVDDMFSGPKTALRPIYDELLKLGRSLGDDVRFCPCKTIVPFYRHHVFAEVKPATQKRIDFGLALGDTKATGTLIDTGGFEKKDRITHRMALEKVKDIDAELKKWLRVAYERDG
jgi:Domain of unknown function (DUF5655)/Domain of unknown function (DUF4287)